MNTTPRLVPWSETFVALLCPCGNEYLHAYAVTAYEGKEGGGGSGGVLGTGGIYQHSVGGRTGDRLHENPSYNEERFGAGVTFWCENCGGRYELTFAQRKGLTLVVWRKVGEERENPF